MSEPLVSILVPTYNGERYLGEALQSALAQSHREIEVVVGDDASSDGTPQLLAEIAAADPRVRVLRHETNVRAYDNTLALIRAARGEYLKFLLHDDVLEPHCVRDLLRGLRSADDVTLAFSHRALIGEDGAPLGSQLPPLLKQVAHVDGTELGDLVLETCRNVIGEMSTVMFRRRDVLAPDLWELDGRRLTANGDVFLWLQLLRRGRAYFTPRTLSRFRTHSGQSSKDPAVIAAGVRDWPLLLDWGRRQGFLVDAGRERRGHCEVVRMAAGVLGAVVDSPLRGAPLEALHLATARLTELDARPPLDASSPLSVRAHHGVLADRFSQELDVWSRRFVYALAVPAVEVTEVEAAVAALREVAVTGTAENLVMAVAPEELDSIIPLIESALSRGPDVDVELVPTDAPSGLLTEDWLVVAPRGRPWHDGRPATTWAYDPPSGRDR